MIDDDLEMAERLLRELRAMHSTSDGRFCDHDNFTWPCPTVRACRESHDISVFGDNL